LSISRDKIIANFREVISQNKPIIGVAVGSGLSAKYAEMGGADFLLVLNAGYFRSVGLSSVASLMPFANSNEIVSQIGIKEIIPRIKKVPVIFGAFPSDPYTHIEYLLKQLFENGFSGINNFPSVGLIDGTFRQALEENGLGFNQEVELIRMAHQAGLFTVAFVFNPEQAREMSKAGADIICANMGFTKGGKIEQQPYVSMKKTVQYCQDIFDVVNEISKNCIKMVYGGPIAVPEETEIIYKLTDAEGYVGGTSFERIPVESGILETTSRFKNLFHLHRENIELKKELLLKKGFDEIVGQTNVMQELYDTIRKAADLNVNVIIMGETGTGKELVARAIHYYSPRNKMPLIKVNCSALPEGILESELFGHEKGSFTGAQSRRLGRFELADKGSIFLDEIGELSLSTQAKILRVIQEKEFERVGGSKTIKVDVRIISATNRNLLNMVENGNFREDLYFRLNVVTIYLPPLRKRMEDIPSLVDYFLRKIRRKYNSSALLNVEPDVLEAFMAYSWPGNVRELENAIEHAFVLGDRKSISFKYLPSRITSAVLNYKSKDYMLPEKTNLFYKNEFSYLDVNKNNNHQKSLNNLYHYNEPSSFKKVVSNAREIMEKDLILKTLASCHWNRTKTAQRLGISRRSLQLKMHKYKIYDSL